MPWPGGRTLTRAGGAQRAHGFGQHHAADRAEQQHIGRADRNIDLAHLLKRAKQERACKRADYAARDERSAEHTSELQSLTRNSYAVFRLHKKEIQSTKELSNMNR